MIFAMKHLQNITLIVLFTWSTGLFAQEAVETAPQDTPDQATTEAIEDTVVEAVEQVTEAVTQEEEATESDQTVESTEAEADAAEAVDEVATVTPVEEAEEKEWIFRRELVSVGGNNSLGPNEKANEMVTVAGNAESSGHINRDMVTVLGSAKLDGYVGGSMVVVMGNAELGPNAVIEREAVVIGGRLTKHPDARVGQEVNIPFLPPGVAKQFEDVPVFISECLFLARPISPNVPFTLYVAGVFMLFYLLLAAIFPGPMERSRKAIEEKPFNSFFAGVLVLACYIPFLILLVISVVGILLVPIFDLALLSISIFGKAVVFYFIGRQIARAIRVRALEHAILSILIGGAIIYAMYMIPFFGLFLFLVFSVLGLGAVCIAIGNSISERKEARQASMPPPPIGTALPGSGAGAAAQAGPGVTVQPGTPLSQVEPATAAIFQRVGFWWRTLATFIDLILVGAITAVLTIQTPLIPLFAYFIIFWGWKGSSLGGMALGIRVQKISGEPMDWPTSIIRSLSSIVSFLPFMIGFFWAGWDPENQSWHDKIAGTTVVRVPKGYTWS